MRGNIDETLFNRINDVFICLVASTIRHWLKSWVIGVYVLPSANEQFKYQTAISGFISFPAEGKQLTYADTYNRFLRTWDNFSAQLRQLLLSTINAELHARIVAVNPKCNTDSAKLILTGDTSSYEQELREELEEAMKAATLPRRKGSDAEGPRASSTNITPPPEDPPHVGGQDKATGEGTDRSQAADNPG